jgi:hypothetical protein
MSEENKRRIIMPVRAERPKDVTVVLEPIVPTLLQDALSVLATEITRFKHKTSQNKPLDVNEARVLQGYIRSLVELAKEQREREDNMDLSNMNDQELLALVDQLRAKREGGSP